MEKEDFINQILNSAHGMAKATPDSALFSKIKSQIQKQGTVTPGTIWLAAASIAVLVGLNITFWISKPDNNMPAQTLENSVFKSNQLY